MAAPKVRISFSEIVDETLPVGPADMIISKVEVRESKKGSQYLLWHFTVADEDLPDHEGRKLTMMSSLNPEALWTTRAIFKALGVPTDIDIDIEIDEDTNEIIFPDFTDLAVRGDIIHEKYNDTDRARVGKILEAYDQVDLDGSELAVDEAWEGDAEDDEDDYVDDEDGDWEEEVEEEPEPEPEPRKPARKTATRKSGKKTGSSDLV